MFKEYIRYVQRHGPYGHCAAPLDAVHKQSTRRCWFDMAGGRYEGPVSRSKPSAPLLLPLWREVQTPVEPRNKKVFMVMPVNTEKNYFECLNFYFTQSGDAATLITVATPVKVFVRSLQS